MAKHIRKNSDGSRRILTDDEAAAEDRANARFIAAAVCAGATAFALYLFFDSTLDSPMKKGAIIVGPLLAFGLGWRLSDLLWALAFLAFAGGALWLVGSWVLS